MNGFKHDPLLNELLSGEEAAACRAASLEQMLAQVRRRGRQRLTRRLTGLAMLSVLLALGLFIARQPAPVVESASRQNPPEIATTAKTAQAAPGSTELIPVRFITDDELLNLFPGRPVALIGAPGRQQFVFLDQKRQTPPGSRQ